MNRTIVQPPDPRTLLDNELQMVSSGTLACGAQQVSPNVTLTCERIIDHLDKGIVLTNVHANKSVNKEWTVWLA